MKYSFVKAVIVIGLVFLFSRIGFSQRCTEPGSIKQITTSSIGKFEYAVFTFNGSTDDVDYSVETAAPPFTDYSGDEAIRVRGSKFRKIVFKSINWTCRTRNIARSQSAIKDVKELWTFEGIAEYAVGFRASSRFISAYHYKSGSFTKVVLKFRK